jgi:hypothetical protein
MTSPFTKDPGHLEEAFAALERDLLDPDGPRISTMRSSDKFAIVPYSPADEFALRRHVLRLTTSLAARGWVVLPISLHALLMDRLHGLPPDELEEIAALEAHAAGRGDLDRVLRHLQTQLGDLIDGPDGLAADVAAKIASEVAAHPEQRPRMLALIGRAGALYPFYRTSGLLKYLAGRTEGVPVVLLYPGERRGDNGLSFMSILEPDRDYRPRIYP